MIEGKAIAAEEYQLQSAEWAGNGGLESSILTILLRAQCG